MPILEKDNTKYEAFLHWMVFYPTLRLIFFISLILWTILFFNLDHFIQVKFNAPTWILWPFGAAVFLLICGSFFSQSIVLLTTRIYLTSTKLFLRTGLFNVQQMELPLKQIESTSVYQDFFGKIFNYGTVTFYGTGGRQPKAFWVINPTALTEEVCRLQDAQE